MPAACAQPTLHAGETGPARGGLAGIHAEGGLRRAMKEERNRFLRLMGQVPARWNWPRTGRGWPESPTPSTSIGKGRMPRKGEELPMPPLLGH
jgi:hypothetical protein